MTSDAVAVLCGGVGAAKFLRGLVDVVDPASITAIVNVADDTELHGLHISPDIDTVLYTMGDAIDPVRGWGLADESWQAMGQFARYGNPTWFNLGDRDLATHIVRTERLGTGLSLSDVTAQLAQAWNQHAAIIPVTNDRVRTMVTVADGEISFQEYFVGRQHDVDVLSIRFDGAESAIPAPGVLAALASAGTVVIAPSNPIVSIGPLLAVPGIRDAVVARRDATVAISPIVAGVALKGPADRMLRNLGHDASVVGVARLYAPLARFLVIDTADADQADAIVDAGMIPIVTDTIMSDPGRAAALARATLAA